MIEERDERQWAIRALYFALSTDIGEDNLLKLVENVVNYGRA